MIKNVLAVTAVAVGLTSLTACAKIPSQSVQSPAAAPTSVSEVKTANGAESNAEVVENAPVFTAFSQEKYSQLLGKSPLAIFFHAGWCPTCVGLASEINANLKTFPQGSVILQADFDKEIELKKTYGVAMQATFVILDKNGKLTATLADPSIADLKDALAQNL